MKNLRQIRACVAASLILASFAAAPGDAEMLADGGLYIPLEDITEEAVFYPLTAGGVDMEVFAVRAPDGTVRTAFNTCQVCHDSGRGYYVQLGGVFVCQNCGNRFSTGNIEIIKGGCNPVPILARHKITDEKGITIPKSTLSGARALFENWKR
ncbi:MAG: DUF2318 domain-containing protein [Synergistaceae bacterium]|nr:DUF2318 domain-containing protein [Synergistaceae bacterium]